MNHTPAPWLVAGRTVYALEDAGYRLGKPVYRNRFSAGVQNGTPTPEDELAANACLMAAAPDLLKELENLVRLLEPIERDRPLNVPGLATLNGARRALAKARGEPQ